MIQHSTFSGKADFRVCLPFFRAGIREQTRRSAPRILMLKFRDVIPDEYEESKIQDFSLRFEMEVRTGQKSFATHSE